MKARKKYSGVIVPLMTPFTGELTVDAASVARLTSHVIAGGGQPFILGTTGEGPSVPAGERKRMVAETVKAAAGKALVYAGISGNCLADAVEEGKLFHELGADVLVATMPSYYPSDSSQTLRYFEALADRLPAPLIIYNIPATTHLSIPVETAEKLSHHPNIAGMKDSEKGEERIVACAKLWKDRPDFSFLCGWAVMSSAAIAQGADGIVPSSGNLAPAVYRALYDAAVEGNRSLASRAQEKADKVSETYQKGRTLNYSLAAFKAILAAYGLCGPAMLPPLYRLAAEEESRLQQEVLEIWQDLETVNAVQQD